CRQPRQEKEVTDEAVGAGVPALAAAGRAQEGQGAAPFLREFQEAGPARGRGGQGAGRGGVGPGQRLAGAARRALLRGGD
ncbi:hypothetical protein CFC21_048651, partial [Triticum aestivum]